MATETADTKLLPGDFLLLARVTDYGTQNETEEYIGNVKEDTTLSPDYETAESNLKEKRVTVRDRTHRSLDLEVMIAESDQVDPLGVMGIDTSTNETDSLEGDVMECLRMYIYRGEPPATGGDGSAAAVKEYFRTTAAIDENAHSTGEHINYTLTMHVNNGWKMGKGGGVV